MLTSTLKFEGSKMGDDALGNTGIAMSPLVTTLHASRRIIQRDAHIENGSYPNFSARLLHYDSGMKTFNIVAS